MRRAISELNKSFPISFFHSTADGLRSVRQNPVYAVVASMDMPDSDGLDYIPQILDEELAKHVIALSDRDDHRTQQMLRESGRILHIDLRINDVEDMQYLVRALVSTQPSPTGVATDARVAYRGFNRRVSGSAQVPPRARSAEPWLVLTPREELIFSVLGAGFDNMEASVILGISPEGVRSHRTRIMSKLDIHHKGQLIQTAIFSGYVRFTNDTILHPGFKEKISSFSRTQTKDDLHALDSH